MNKPKPIKELQAMYKAIHGIEAGDVHRLQASYMFDVPYIEVTKEQRSTAKACNYSTCIRMTCMSHDVHEYFRRAFNCTIQGM